MTGISSGSLCFLVIDDSATVRRMLALTLGKYRGSRVIEAANGAEGLAKLHSEKIDLMLTDINMPVMDGLKLVGFIRQNPAFQQLPIIIITTRGADEDRDRGLALGANAYIPKPIQSGDLVRTIDRLLAEQTSGKSEASASGQIG